MKIPKTIAEVQAAARERQARFMASKVKLQIYVSVRLVRKLDKACAERQEKRGELIRRLIDSLPD